MSEKFKELLDEKHSFPCSYKFKFIVKSELLSNVTEKFEKDELAFNYSSNKKYCSVTVDKVVSSSSEIIKIYEGLSKIKGIISL